MSKPEDKRVLSLAALGRPFRLGMLYDSRTEMLIPGITLWNEAVLQNKTVQQHESSDFYVIRSDSLHDKATALEVNGSLKLSIMGGLVSVEGAAKYIDNRKTSCLQERLTLLYKCTTRSESMTMEQLGQGNIQHPEVFDHGTATHVVTSIVYGARAFFVFDRRHSSSSHEEEIEGNVHAILEKLPSIKINGKGELELSENEKSKTDEFSCRFIGDFVLRQNPSTFLDAVKAYQELPSLLGAEGEKAVPMKVELYPLSLIDTKAACLVREISISLVNEVQNFFEDMQDIIIRCKDILKSDAAKYFQGIQFQMQEFLNVIETYKHVKQKELSVMLPQIRGGDDKEESLVKLLINMSQSPFSRHTLRSWLQAKSTQVKVLNEYIRALPNVRFAKEPGDLESVVLSPNNRYTLCFTISIPSSNSLLETMKRYFLETNPIYNHKEEGDLTGLQQRNRHSMSEVANVFSFYASNNTRSEFSFFLSQEFCECETFYAQVKCYRRGKLISDDYELPSAPEKVIADDVTHDSVTISWNPPEYGASTMQYYVVSYCKKDMQQNTSQITVDRDHHQTTITGLAANTAYEVQVCVRCEVGDGPFWDGMLAVRTKPASQPERLRALKTSPTKVCLRWMPPSCVANGCNVEEYIIKQETAGNHWEERARTSSTVLTCTVEVAPNSAANFKVVASCRIDGVSKDSEVSIVDLADPVTLADLKERICTNSREIQKNPCIYVPNLNVISTNAADMVEKMQFGDRKLDIPEKVIMLVGPTGSGKTTLINGFVNYIFGVEWKDPFRFKMIIEPNVANQAMSQTTKITSYTLHHQEGFRVPYSLTIIDTPGFGDVSGIMRDKEITESIRTFFTTRGANGISHIDAVGFVANSSLPRLTPTQRYIFDQILSLFGKDIADNIFLLLTFADDKRPQVLSGIKEAKIPYRKHFKFNNSALYARQCNESGKNKHDSGEEEEEDEVFDHTFWKTGFKSFSLFLEQLNSVESKSLILTQDVLTERSRLETYISGIERDIKQGLSTLERLKEEGNVLKTHHAEIERNKNFEYEVEEEIYTQVAIPPGQYITNCLVCNRTCHANCTISGDTELRECWAMTKERCRVCPGKCIWSVHKSFPYKYELTIKKTKKTVNELRERYEEATQRKCITENLIEELNEEFSALKVKVLGMADTVRKSLENLQEIALRPNPLTTVQYIDILMQAERSQAEQGWQARLEQLSIVKKEAEYMEMIADIGFSPFK